ncbi:SOS response-associated peptidase [Kitasatospora sp. NPDC051853]|uniref:SOS response-associated peptidase n=1 Tax=Kitasatospora sp. NPDC051853 TaxID=3364058 RepID=UPI0037951D23
MCGRFVSTSTPSDIAQLLRAVVQPSAETLAPSWNVAPTNLVATVLERVDRETGELVRGVEALRWGLVPSWSKDPKVGARMINARVETAHEKPSFRKAFTTRRCVVPGDGYYEWKPVEAAEGRKAYKQPYYLHRPDGGPLLMAGLYEYWRDRSVTADDDPAAWLVTCTLLTTEAVGGGGGGPPRGPRPPPPPPPRGAPAPPPPHDRMPVTLHPDRLDAWLDPELSEVEQVRALLSGPAAELAIRPVGTAVNGVRSNGPQLLVEVADPLAGVTGGHDA